MAWQNTILSGFTILLTLALVPFSAANIDNSIEQKTSVVVLKQQLSGPISKELVWKTFKLLVEQYKADHKLHATLAERKAVKLWGDQQQKATNLAMRQQLAELELLQNQNALTDDEQKLLTRLKNLLKAVGEPSDIELDLESANLSVEDKAKYQLMLTTMYDGMIESWKVNRALFNQYGGRIKFQQAGLEPIDAWLAFMREQEAAGNFHIVAADQRTVFWQIFLDYVNSGSLSDEVDDSFDIPLWER